MKTPAAILTLIILAAHADDIPLVSDSTRAATEAWVSRRFLPLAEWTNRPPPVTPDAPVTSVNGETGDVLVTKVLDADGNEQWWTFVGGTSLVVAVKGTRPAERWAVEFTDAVSSPQHPELPPISWSVFPLPKEIGDTLDPAKVGLWTNAAPMMLRHGILESVGSYPVWQLLPWGDVVENTPIFYTPFMDEQLGSFSRFEYAINATSEYEYPSMRSVMVDELYDLDPIVYDLTKLMKDGLTTEQVIELIREHASGITTNDVLDLISKQIPPSLVESVNGQTGHVVLTAAGIGAATTNDLDGKLDITSPPSSSRRANLRWKENVYNMAGAGLWMDFLNPDGSVIYENLTGILPNSIIFDRGNVGVGSDGLMVNGPFGYSFYGYPSGPESQIATKADIAAHNSDPLAHPALLARMAALDAKAAETNYTTYTLIANFQNAAGMGMTFSQQFSGWLIATENITPSAVTNFSQAYLPTIVRPGSQVRVVTQHSSATPLFRGKFTIPYNVSTVYAQNPEWKILEVEQEMTGSTLWQKALSDSGWMPLSGPDYGINGNNIHDVAPFIRVRWDLYGMDTSGIVSNGTLAVKFVVRIPDVQSENNKFGW